MTTLKAGDAETARLVLDDIDNGKYKEALHRVDKKLKKTDLDYFKVCDSDRTINFDVWNLEPKSSSHIWSRPEH